MRGNQIDSPIPGKKKNCTEWAQYEPQHSSEAAALCHGGWYRDPKEGHRHYEPCPCRPECKAATEGRAYTPEHRRLPVINPTGISYNQQPFSSIQRPSFTQPPGFRAPVPASLPAQSYVKQRINEYVDSAVPRPVVPPVEYPHSMQTPYVASLDSGGGSPTFLPQSGEDVFERLAKNMIQAAIATCGWQVFNYLRSIDLFKIL